VIIRTSDYVRIHILPDNAKCKEAGKSPCDLDYCPFAKFDQFGMVCVPSECEYYTEETTQQMNNKMEPIVTDIPTSEMSMTELLHNCCYVKNGEAKYRDYSSDNYARDIVRELLRQYAVDDFPDVAEMLDEDTETFDDWLLTSADTRDYTDDIVGLIGLLYRVMISAAELREHLKYYESTRNSTDEP
jgi:hypothetical protein